MELYFGNALSVVASIMVIMATGYIVYTVAKQKNITAWGRRTALLAVFGLIICCVVATRDNYHLSVQASFDDSIKAGIFSLQSIQSTICCIGGAVIAYASLSSVFVKSQKYRKVMFFTLGSAMIVKMLVVEISRCVLL